MSNDATEIVVGANGRVLSAATEDVASWPDDISSPLDAAFTEAGFISEDGITFTDTPTITDIMAWQAFYPIRKIVSSKVSKVEFVLHQWNSRNVKLAFGGGVTDVAGGVSVYTPPEPGELTNRAIVVEWVDGPDTYRLVLPRGLVDGEVSVQVMRTAATDLPISYEVTPSGTPDDPADLAMQPWYLVTDAAGFASGS